MEKEKINNKKLSKKQGKTDKMNEEDAILYAKYQERKRKEIDKSKLDKARIIKEEKVGKVRADKVKMEKEKSNKVSSNKVKIEKEKSNKKNWESEIAVTSSKKLNVKTIDRNRIRTMDGEGRLETNKHQNNRKEIKEESNNGCDRETIKSNDNGKKVGKHVSRNRELIHITFVFVGLFLCMVTYFIYFLAFESKDVINSPYNKRQDLLAEQIVRGQILTSDDKIISYTKVDEDKKETRVYPFNNLFSHIVGRVNKGRTGIESSENFLLLTSNDYGLRKIYNELAGEKNIGDSVITTLDSSLSQIAYDGLGNNKGSVVVMEPSSGKILAMVSKSDYDPNTITEDWSILSNDTVNSPLLNRSTQGLYPPGSTYKILTLLEYIREHPDHEEYEYECTGTAIFNGVVINCYNKKAHGKVNLMESFAKSCNTSFANMGINIDMNQFLELNNKFMFNQELPSILSASKSSFVLEKNSDKSEIPQTVLGQGKTLVTPLHMAMITAGIANGGVVMKPYVVDEIRSINDVTTKKYLSSLHGAIMTSKEADILTSYMQEVVENGTASSLKDKEYTVAGKTGSAEFERNKSAHAWFVGFAPIDNPEIVVSIVVEGVGTGSQYAVPIASRIFDKYFNLK